jgi:hypothetical protein
MTESRHNIIVITRCMGRLEHLKQSLPKFAAQFPTVMVDWSCPEKSGDWAKTVDNVSVIRVQGSNIKTFSQGGSRNTGAEHTT